jgi:hypothetical protein
LLPRNPPLNIISWSIDRKEWRWAARIFGFGRGFGEGAGLNNPVTELKRSRKPKKPLLSGPYRPIATGFMEML